MTIDEAQGLERHQTVHWTDPDNGLCSRDYTIDTIGCNHSDNTVMIQDFEGDVLQCPAEELSRAERGGS